MLGPRRTSLGSAPLPIPLAPRPSSPLPCHPPFLISGLRSNRRLPDDARAHLTGSLGPLPAARPKLNTATAAGALRSWRLGTGKGSPRAPCVDAVSTLPTMLPPHAVGSARRRHRTPSRGSPSSTSASLLRRSDLTSCGHARLSPLCRVATSP